MKRFDRHMASAALLLIGLAGSEGAAETAPPPARSGAEIYASICQGCHMADGGGAVGAASYPALRDNPALASTAFMAVVILHGRRNMPAFAAAEHPQFFFEPTWLSDQEVANVINHVRSHFGNAWTDTIDADTVATLRH